jgi:ABC-type proline/glycine betaine transport system permease subunit
VEKVEKVETVPTFYYLVPTFYLHEYKVPGHVDERAIARLRAFVHATR